MDPRAANVHAINDRRSMSAAVASDEQAANLLPALEHQPATGYL